MHSLPASRGKSWILAEGRFLTCTRARSRTKWCARMLQVGAHALFTTSPGSARNSRLCAASRCTLIHILITFEWKLLCLATHMFVSGIRSNNIARSEIIITFGESALMRCCSLAIRFDDIFRPAIAYVHLTQFATRVCGDARARARKLPPQPPFVADQRVLSEVSVPNRMRPPTADRRPL